MRKSQIFIFVLGCMLSMQSCKGETPPMETSRSTPPDSLALNYLVKEPSIQSAQPKAIILLHGLGSNETDLFGLADYLPKDCYIICPRATYTLSGGSYAWYDVDFSTGKPVYDKTQEAHSREAMMTFIQQVKEKYGISEVYLGGFSQGAIMSCTIGLLHPGSVKGVMCLSGRILREIRSEVKASAALHKLNVFLAHGTQDGTLSVDFAREAKNYLEQLGVPLSYHEYEMGHQINADVIRDLNLWLASAMH